MIGKSVQLNSWAAIFKHLNILASFGGTKEETKASLDLIARGVLTPQVEMDSMANFPRVLQGLHEGKIKSRIALVPEGI